MYTYKAELIRVVDGDTVDLKVDLGFRMSTVTRFRLYGIDAPERDKKAKAHLFELLSDSLTIETHKDPDNFGRWLCTIYKGETNINKQMVEDGFAEEYNR